jgi:plastocyanin domain-containing protein
MQDLMVNIGGIVLMGAVVWWFWLSGSDSKSADHQHHH